MDIANVLRDILVVLVAAKAAAEVAERVGIPAVVGEIVAGVLIGPSVLGFVNGDEVLRTLGELGVILLLLDVGLEMDLGELGKVGRASVLVAAIGVAAPMLLGIGAMELLGHDFNTALFVGAALTATSVGITARVFGDLRALATTEARVVLGAAVADDVMGLVVLTVVVRIVTEGSVSIASVIGIVGLAIGFLVVAGYAGLRLASPLFAAVERVSRSTGTMVALGLAFTLGFAELADAAKLAPIVGAFVAGIALSRSRQADRIRRELTPVGHLFIPVFFLQIGIDADVGVFGQAEVLRTAGLLLAVAVVGKVVSPIGAFGVPADKPLIGLGMLPRGEVGLIFATIGLQNRVLGEDLYGALLLVVLVTTLATPQLLKMRYSKIRRRSDHLDAATAAERLKRLLTAAIDAARTRPDPELVAELVVSGSVLTWDDESRERLLDVIERGNARSWRLLMTTGMLAAALPEIDAVLAERAHDTFNIDPLHAYRLRSMERLRGLDTDDPLAGEIRRLDCVDDLLFAGWLADTLDESPDAGAVAGRVLSRLGVSEHRADAVSRAVDDRDLMWTAAHQPGGLTERAVLPLAAHFQTPQQARLVYALSALRDDGRERWQRARLRELFDLLTAALSEPTLASDTAAALDAVRRDDARRLIGRSPAATDRLDRAPRVYILHQTPDAIARHVCFVDPLPKFGSKVQVSGGWIDVAGRDQRGFLASTATALAKMGYDVVDALATTWDDGAALQSFRVQPDAKLGGDEIERAIDLALLSPLQSEPHPDAVVTFIPTASPWHTVCEVRVTDRPGVLRDMAIAFAVNRVNVLALSAVKEDEFVVDRFEVVDRRGQKLDRELQRRVEASIRDGAELVRSGRRGRRRTPRDT